jgi:hypothetical protein
VNRALVTSGHRPDAAAIGAIPPLLRVTRYSTNDDSQRAPVEAALEGGFYLSNRGMDGIVDGVE